MALSNHMNAEQGASTGPEVLPPSEKMAPYELNLPGCKSLATDDLTTLRIVHAVYVGVPPSCANCGSSLFGFLKFGEQNLWDNPDGSTLMAVHLFVPRLRCLECGTPIWCEPPWIYPGARMTSRLVQTILDFLGDEPRSYAQIARNTGVNSAKIQEILRIAHVELDRMQGNLLGETTGIDDFCTTNGQRVTTVGTTSPGGRLVAIIEAEDAKTVRKELSQFPNRDEVRILTLDFSNTFVAAALKGDKDVPAPLLKAKPAANRFHFAKQIIKAYSNAQNKFFIQIRADLKRSDPVSRQQFLFAVKSADQLKREADKRAGKSAKPIKSLFWSLRRLLTKRPEKLKEPGKAIVQSLFEKYPLLGEAYQLKNFALDLRLKGKSTEQAMAEFELFKMRLGKLSRRRGGSAIAKCFEPFVKLIEKWEEAAFPTIAGSNNNLERMHEDMRTFIRISHGCSIPGLLRRMQWRQANKRVSRWPKKFAGQRGMTLRKAVEILGQQRPL